MANRETRREKLAALSARTSTEAIVGILIAGATAVILVLAIATGGRDDSHSPEPVRLVGLRHDAISLPATGDTTQQDVPTPAADKGPEPSDGDSVVRDGVTIVSPPLLVPVISPEAMQAANGSDHSTSSPRKPSSAPKRSHYAKPARTSTQPRIVGLAASRRLVTAVR